jgi:hypothetical protein
VHRGSESQLYKKLHRAGLFPSVKQCYGNVLNFIRHLLKPLRVLIAMTDYFRQLLHGLSEDEGQDEVDGSPHLDPKLLKEGKSATCMRNLITYYKRSKAFDSMALNNGSWNRAEIFGDLFSPIILRIFLINSLANTETIQWTWQTHMDNLPEMPRSLYHPTAKSRQFIHRWYVSQYIDVWKLTEDLIDILDKKRQKVNSLLIMGQGNSGKTVIANSIFEAFKARAIVTNGASVGISWQDAVNCRIILNEECIIAPMQTEEYKQIMSGADCMVNVKGKPARHLTCTPIIFTTNTLPWTFVKENDIYESRCVRYSGLTRQEWMVFYDKNISPLGWKYYADHVYDERQKDMNRMKYGEASDYFDNEAEFSND